MTRDAELDSNALDLARECIYRFLATALSDPYVKPWDLIEVDAGQVLFKEATAIFRDEFAPNTVSLGFGELGVDFLDANGVVEEIRNPSEPLRDQYDRVFGLVQCRECPPYETEYHASSEAFFRAQALADVAGFYHAFGLQPGSSPPERPDHVSLELEFISFLLLKKRQLTDSTASDMEKREKKEICDAAQRAFFTEHLAWWLPAFASGLRRKAASGFYAALGSFLTAFVPLERARWNVAPPRLSVEPQLIERPEEQEACAGCS